MSMQNTDSAFVMLLYNLWVFFILSRVYLILLWFEHVIVEHLFPTQPFSTK